MVDDSSLNGPCFNAGNNGFSEAHCGLKPMVRLGLEPGSVEQEISIIRVPQPVQQPGEPAYVLAASVSKSPATCSWLGNRVLARIEAFFGRQQAVPCPVSQSGPQVGPTPENKEVGPAGELRMLSPFKKVNSHVPGQIAVPDPSQNAVNCNGLVREGFGLAGPVPVYPGVNPVRPPPGPLIQGREGDRRPFINGTGHMPRIPWSQQFPHAQQQNFYDQDMPQYEVDRKLKQCRLNKRFQQYWPNVLLELNLNEIIFLDFDANREFFDELSTQSLRQTLVYVFFGVGGPSEMTSFRHTKSYIDLKLQNLCFEHPHCGTYKGSAFMALLPTMRGAHKRFPRHVVFKIITHLTCFKELQHSLRSSGRSVLTVQPGCHLFERLSNL